MDTRATIVHGPFIFVGLAFVASIVACSGATGEPIEVHHDDLAGSAMLPTGDVEKVQVAAVGDTTSFFRDIDDGASSSLADGDTTTIRNRYEYNSASYTASYSGGPSGTVTAVDVHFRGRRQTNATGTFTVSLYDGTTLLATGKTWTAQHDYTDYVDTFSGLSVANANNLRTRIDFHRTSGTERLMLTQMWLVASTSTTGSTTDAGTTTGTTDAATTADSSSPTGTGTGSSTYTDDTFSAASGAAASLTLTGSHGYTPYSYDTAADGKSQVLDARGASFVLANSQNDNPTTAADCNTGSLPVNRYPFVVQNADFTAVVGGLWNGLVPQQSDWEPTYCNSAGINFRSAPNGTVDGVRVTNAWDAVRPSDGSPGMTIKDSWFSGVRDDVFENDHLYSALVKDILVDGSFQLFSNKASSTSTATDGSANTVVVKGSVLRVRNYVYKGVIKYGSLFKTMSPGAPKHTVHDTVLAVDPGSGVTVSTENWAIGWTDMVACNNNVFLWMSDLPIPSSIGTIPSCFTVVKGQAAIDMWNKAKTNWINCHPKVARAAGDPVSDPTQCTANTFGGYSN